jgi:hypothetical protein
MNRKMAVLGAAGLVALVVLSAIAYEVYYAPRESGCPAIFADVTFRSSEGFVTVIHPTSATTEFVLAPNRAGQITVSYSSTLNNFTASSFADPVTAWRVNLANGTLYTDVGLNVSEIGRNLVSMHQVLVNYTVNSGPSTGVYVLGLPSTCLTTIVSVGNQPYTGPLPWLNGIRA